MLSSNQAACSVPLVRVLEPPATVGKFGAPRELPPPPKQATGNAKGNMPCFLMITQKMLQSAGQDLST